MTTQNLEPLIEALGKGLNDAMKTIAEKSTEATKSVSEVLLPVIIEEGTKTIEGIKQDAKEAWDEFLAKIKENETPANIVALEVELLDSKKLLEIAKANIVNGSNEVYAMKKQKGDNMFVYLAYGKDKVPFESDKNKYVIIKTEALKSDVLGLFDKTELVILK